MKRYLVLAAAGGLGLAALVHLFPETDASSGWQFALSREEAIARAHAAATAYGLNTRDWKASATATVAYRREWQLRRVRSQAIRELAAASTVRVLLVGGKAGSAQIELDPRGRLRRFEHRGPAGSPAQETAERAAVILADFAGPHAPGFRLATDGVPHAEGTRFTYEYRDPEARFVVVRFEVTLRGGQPVQAAVSPEFFGPSARLVQRWEVSRQMISAVLLALGAVSIFVMMPVFFRSFVRKRISMRLPLAAGATVFLVSTAVYFGGAGFQEAQWAAFGDFPALIRTSSMTLVGRLVLAAFLTAFLGAALGLAGPETRRAWYALGMLFSRGAFSRAVGVSVVAGLLAGAALSPLPHLMARVIAVARPAGPPPGEGDPKGGPKGGFKKGPRTGFKAGPPGGAAPLGLPPASLMRLSEPADLMAPAPLLSLANGLPYWQFVVLFALIFPLTDRGGWIERFGKPWVRWGLAIPIGLLVFGLLALYFAPGLAPNFVLGLILTAVWCAVYLKFDLLTVITGELAMNALWFAGAAFNQPSPALVSVGWMAAGLLALTFVLALAAMAFGRRTDADAFIAAQAAMAAGERSSDRERLHEEFALARRAQQSLLRPVERVVGKLGLAASCTPALEVGGDLYDHFHYPDGRLGLCVADVSGKGVPAALFMTMTKGVLAAARHDSGDWPPVLTELNGYLGGAARRRSFVTLAAASIDPETGIVDHARAGHNPVLWRRTARGESLFLKPPGLGLGLAANGPFARVLRMERIQLEPGDALVFYSDGITEAMNARREQFGEDRLQQAVESCDGRDAAATEAAILDAVRTFMGTSPPHDDMTLFVVRAGLF